ncbi:DHS-like NAD/FAD-binding domain-containing protein, partial [Phakopsora pachyrhizi]
LKTRKKLTQFNTLEDLVELIKTRSRIMILTGAGISTSCGIPDFRSSDGLYSQLSKEYEDELDDACQMFDLRFFKSKPQIFYSFAKQIFPFSASFLKRETDQKHQSETASEGCYPKSIEPSDSHRFLKLLEFKSKLLRNYTQNIDTLEMKAGVKNLIQCHGSFASFKCLRCDQRFESSEDFERSIYRSEVIVCPICREDLRSEDVPAKKKRKRKRSLDFEGSDSESSDESIDWVSRGLVKPEIIFFGEGLPRTFDEAFETDRYKADLVIVMGTSLAVSPVSDILDYVAEDVPQILINRDPIRGVNFDICCLGDSDLIVRELCKRLGDGWRLDDMRRFQVSGDGQNDELKEQRCGKRHGGSDEEKEVNGSKEEPKRVGESHVWLFRGADTNHPWLRRWMEQENTEASGSR